MRINRIARRFSLAAALVAGPTLSSIHAQAPGGPPQTPPAQGAAPAPAAAPAGSPAGSPAEPPTEAERLIDEAIKKIAAVKTVSADLVQDVQMLGQKFQIKGRYLRAPESRIYLRLDVVGLPGSAGSMLQVCNGDLLWDYQKILESPSYRRLSVKPILERLKSPEIDAVLKEQILASLGFTGPEALLAGVRKAVRFNQFEEGEVDGRPVWIVRGSWRDRGGLVTPDQRPVAPMGMLPPFLPSIAALSIDKENGWPYRLNFDGRPESLTVDTRQVGPDGQRIGSKSSIQKQAPSKLRLVYSNVQFDPSLSDVDFAFQAPADAQVEDNTEAILQGLDTAIERQAQQKRIEAANRGGSVLEQAIQVPTTPPASEIPK